MPVGMTMPSRSPSSSSSTSSSVLGRDADVELDDGDAAIPNPREEYASDDAEEDV
jgi:hypothetical protein